MPLAAPNYPVAIVEKALPAAGSPAPPPFDGIWFHTMPQAVLENIRTNGWDPRQNLHSTFGCAVYLSQQPWRLDNQLDRAQVQCWLELDAASTQTGFGKDNTSDELLAALGPPEIELRGIVKKVTSTTVSERLIICAASARVMLTKHGDILDSAGASARVRQRLRCEWWRTNLRNGAQAAIEFVGA